MNGEAGPTLAALGLMGLGAAHAVITALGCVGHTGSMALVLSLGGLRNVEPWVVVAAVAGTLLMVLLELVPLALAAVAVHGGRVLLRGGSPWWPRLGALAVVVAPLFGVGSALLSLFTGACVALLGGAVQLGLLGLGLGVAASVFLALPARLDPTAADDAGP